MKKNISMAITQPCHENWESMAPAESGRFCASCQKQVVDFSTMTDKEIFDHISSSLKPVCGRADFDQLNRNLSIPSMNQCKPALRWWMGWAAGILMTISVKSVAQSRQKKSLKSVQTRSITMGTMDVVVLDKAEKQIPHPQEILVSGRIIDNKGLPVQFATVMIDSANEGVAADSLGVFKLLLNPVLVSRLSVTAIGLKEKIVSIDSNMFRVGTKSGSDTQVVLIGDISMEPSTMPEVVITRFPVISCVRLTMGGMGYRVKATKWQYLKDTLKSAIGISELKVYPNPITRNSRFNIQFRLKEKGEYTLQFLDAAAHIVGGSRLNIVSAEQVESFDSHIFSSGGIYYVVARSANGQAMFSAKLLVP